LKLLNSAIAHSNSNPSGPNATPGGANASAPPGRGMFRGFGFGANLIMQPPQNQIIPKDLPEGLGLSGQGGQLASSGDKAKNYN